MANRARGVAAHTSGARPIEATATSVAAMAVPIGAYPTRLGVAVIALLLAFAVRPLLTHKVWVWIWTLLAALLISGFVLQTITVSADPVRILWRFGWNQILAVTSAVMLALLAASVMQRSRPWWLLLPLLFLATAPNHSTVHIVESNPWKYWLAWPTALTVLILVRHRPVANFLAHALLIALNLLWDYRSAAAVTFASLVLHLMQHPIRSLRHRIVNGTVVDRFMLLGFAIGAIVVFGYVTLTSYLALALSGNLGRAIQLKQSAQADTVGGIFEVGRAESSATLELFDRQPFGYGLGILPSWTDIHAAARAVMEGGGSPSTARSIIATDGLHLHSIAGELWYSFGLVGLLGAVLLAFVAVRLILASLDPTIATSKDRIPAIVGAWLLWDVLFSPLESNWPMLGLALGLALYFFGSDGSVVDGWASADGARASKMRLPPATPADHARRVTSP